MQASLMDAKDDLIEAVPFDAERLLTLVLEWDLS
jgi:hypothetical protein